MTIESIMESVINHELIDSRIKDISDDDLQNLMEIVIGRVMTLQMGGLDSKNVSSITKISDSFLFLAAVARCSDEARGEKSK